MAATSLLLPLLQNAAMLLALVVLYAVSSRPFSTQTWLGPKKSLRADIGSGLVLGVMAILIIATPVRYNESIIFDARSVLISLTALYFSWIPACIVMLLAALYRIALGGAIVTALMVILVSGGCGMLWRHYCRHRLGKLGVTELMGLGICVHALVMLVMLTLPPADRRAVIEVIVLPFMVLFPLLTVLMGKLLSHFLHTEDLARQAQENAQRLQLAMDVARQELFELDLQQGVIHTLPREDSEARYPDRNLVGNLAELFREVHPDDLPGIEAQLQEVQSGQTREWHGDMRQRLHNGSWAWAHVAGRVVASDDQGQPKTFLGTYVDITARKEAEEQLWQQANIDKVTGLPNRSMFLNRLRREVRRATNSGNRLALLFFDLDNFKEVNDSLGHDAGDELLQQVASRIRALEGEYTLLARIGGDEYVLILADLRRIGSARELADKVLHALEEPFVLREKPVYASASLGISIFPDDGDSGEILLRNADQAMYAAKREGGRRARFFTPAMQEAVDRKTVLVSAMREALVDSAFEVHYQPVVSLQTQQVVKVEALLRWEHPVMGWINPGTFIPLAEEYGLIVALGNFVLRRVLADMKLLDQVRPALHYSVNKSPAQFSSVDDCWLELLAGRPDVAGRIVVEITEGLLLDERPLVQQHLRRLQHAGLRIAIDDFGTGYSSLAYLKRFQVAFLKIDRSFVCNLAPGNEDDTICQAMITMAHRLGISVIAEGIESGLQCDLLRAAGCDLAQGYLFSEALDVKRLTAFLAAHP